MKVTCARHVGKPIKSRDALRAFLPSHVCFARALTADVALHIRRPVRIAVTLVTPRRAEPKRGVLQGKFDIS